MEENNSNTYSEKPEAPETRQGCEQIQQATKTFYKKPIFWICTGLVICIISLFIILFAFIHQNNNTSVNNDSSGSSSYSTQQDTRKDPDGYISLVRSCLNTGTINVKEAYVTSNNDGDELVVKITMPGFASVLADTLTYNYIPDDYYNMIDKMKQLCIALMNNGVNYGYNNIDCDFELLNDLNPDKILIAIYSGTLIYDVANGYQNY